MMIIISVASYSGVENYLLREGLMGLFGTDRGVHSLQEKIL